jgi:hypothetical protein
MPVIIPITAGVNDQQITTTIDTVSYVLRVRWNTRDAAWCIDAWERDGTTAIAFGVKIVVGILLGQAIQHPLFMAGMFAWDTSGSDLDPGLNDLGNRVLLVSLTAGDRTLLSLPVVTMS